MCTCGAHACQRLMPKDAWPADYLAGAWQHAMHSCMAPKRRLLYVMVALFAISNTSGSAQQEARGVGSSEPAGHELDLLKSCYNHKYTRAPLGFVRWLHGADSRLYLYRGWWSDHAPPSAPLTVFTMSSLNRLALLEAQCRSFAGPHVAAVYLPLRVVAEADDVEEGPIAAREGMTRKAAAVKEDMVQEEGGNGEGNTSKWRESVRGKGSRAVGARQGGGEEGRGGVIPGHEALGWMSEAHQRQIRNAERRLQKLFDRLEAAAAASAPAAAGAAPSHVRSGHDFGPCASHLMLFIELVADPQLLALMPTNALRNAAMLAVRTPLSLMLDADLSLNPLLSALVRGKHPDRLLDLERAAVNRTLSVLAAWETSSRMPDREANAMTDKALRGPKEQLSDLWLNEDVQVFSWLQYRKGHGPTNHGHWLHAKEPYPVPYSEGYEPWGVLARLSDPGYDERFRGWMRDKIMHVATLAYLNFSFVVQHDMWVIHRPHKLAVAAAIIKKQAELAASAGLVHTFHKHVYGMRRKGTAFQHYLHHVMEMYNKTQVAMRTRSYVPYQGPQFTQCLESLPWWRVPKEVLRHEAERGSAEGWVAPGVVGPKDGRGVPLPRPPPWRLVRWRQKLKQEQQQQKQQRPT